MMADCFRRIDLTCRSSSLTIKCERTYVSRTKISVSHPLTLSLVFCVFAASAVIATSPEICDRPRRHSPSKRRNSCREASVELLYSHRPPAVLVGSRIALRRNGSSATLYFLAVGIYDVIRNTVDFVFFTAWVIRWICGRTPRHWRRRDYGAGPDDTIYTSRHAVKSRKIMYMRMKPLRLFFPPCFQCLKRAQMTERALWDLPII
jgi:hypothetical protein